MLLAVNPKLSTLSKAWPSSSSGGSASTIRVSRRSSRLTWKSLTGDRLTGQGLGSSGRGLRADQAADDPPVHGGGRLSDELDRGPDALLPDPLLGRPGAGAGAAGEAPAA